MTASIYVPVETVLKVAENEILIENKGIEQFSSDTPTSSIGIQCSWKLDHSQQNFKKFLSNDEKEESDFTPETEITALHSDQSFPSDQKLIIPTVICQQYACSLPSSNYDEKFLLQFDYKTRNKLKTKQRRMDPSYRSQERMRQRAVMRLKRQDPKFREAEREKGRYRMRLKRLDPEFRFQERERQRQRMKVKRSDPNFREKEREQQKARLHEKRLDPLFKEKERSQDLITIQIMQKNKDLYSDFHLNKKNVHSENEDLCITSDKILKNNCKSNDLLDNFQSNHPVLSFNEKMLVKSRESMLEAFNLKQHIFNFNFYSSDKELQSHQFSYRTSNQVNDINKNIFFHNVFPDGNTKFVKQYLDITRLPELKVNTTMENISSSKSS